MLRIDRMRRIRSATGLDGARNEPGMLNWNGLGRLLASRGCQQRHRNDLVLASAYLKRSRIDIPHVQFFGT